jgi:hypothetical protein
MPSYYELFLSPYSLSDFLKFGHVFSFRALPYFLVLLIDGMNFF